VTLISSSMSIYSYDQDNETTLNPTTNIFDTFLTIADLNWSFGISDREVETFDINNSLIGYTYEINETEFHLEETTGLYDVLLGAAAEVPVVNNTLSLTFEGRVRAEHTNVANLRLGFYDPYTYQEIKWWSIFTSADGSPFDTGYRFYNKTFFLEGYSSIIIHFYQEDDWSLNWNQQFWIRDLKIFMDADQSIILTDPSISFVTAPSSECYGLEWYDNYLWNINGRKDLIYKIDPDSGEVLENHTLPTDEPRALTITEDAFWYSEKEPFSLYKCNSSFDVLDWIMLSFSPSSGMAVVEDGFWVAYGEANMMYKLNKTDGSIMKSFLGPGQKVKGLAYDGENLWVGDNIEHRIYQVNPENGKMLFSYKMPFVDIWGITIDNNGNIWVCDVYTGIISKLNIVTTKPDDEAPMISNMLLIPPGSEEIVGLEWYIIDSSSSGHYWIYINETLHFEADWESPIGETAVTILFEFYVSATYNFTIVVADKYGNKAFDIMIYTIEDEIISTQTLTDTNSPEDTNSYSILLALLTLLSVASICMRKKITK